ncbi:hypothetical protein [Flavobacterium sp. N1736]|uniref:hypothetical protein n=1 Tax=Flavobacterium sp. N1736 TaxID=2986823 RepID=UPI002223F55E|nr:hypothetical protein [Flavobacterium sp. N1736]
MMKIYSNAVFLIILLAGCQSPKKKYDFTFFKWNIRESYYLKFNSSDTLYHINTYRLEEQTSFTILDDDERERIQIALDNLSFPKEKEFSNSLIEDGETNAFYLKDDKQYQQLKIHGHQGPDQFWLFGKTLTNIKNQHNFMKINKKFDLSGIEKMVAPPILFIQK